VLRSKSPDLVLQEIWGHLCCHFAIRTLMWEAADHAQVDPDRVSFVAALRIARRSISAARDFPPQGSDHGWRHVIVQLCRRSTPSDGTAANLGSSSASTSTWHVKRAHRRDWPQPTGPPTTNNPAHLTERYWD
jgi:hypothetical protein